MTWAIDYWINPFTPEHMKRCWIDEPEFSRGRTESRPGRWGGYSVDAFIEVLDDAEVERAFIPSWKMYSFNRKELMWDFSVEEIADVVAAHPKRLAGLFGINPHRRLDAVRALERAVVDHGFVGAHLHTFGYGLPINHRDYYPFYAKCVELDIPVVMQIGHSLEMMPNEMGRPVHLEDVLLYFPELRVVAAHTGWPWVEELISLSLVYPNVYIGTTAHAPEYWDQALVQYMNTRGIGKVIWGTDWPVIEHQRARAGVSALNLKPEAE
jgi:hypothetical protein